MNQPFEGCEVLDIADSLGIWCNEGDPAKWLAYRCDGKAHLEPSGSWEEWVALAHAVLEREERLATVVAVAESAKLTLRGAPGRVNVVFFPPDAETKGDAPLKLKPGDRLILDIVANHQGKILEVVPRWPQEGEVPA